MESDKLIEIQLASFNSKSNSFAKLTWASIFSIFLLFGITANGQNKIQLNATVIDKDGFTDFPNLLIVNKSSGESIFGSTNGKFSFKINKTDTLLIGAIGYKTKKYFVNSTVSTHIVSDTILIEKLQFDLNTVSVFGERDLKEIHSELEELKFDRAEYMLSGIDAMQSPITFLYQALSREEKRKRRAYEIIIEDRRRDVLKELFKKYVDADVIYLEDTEFDEFIDFCKLPPEVIKGLTQYEFIMLVKMRYRAFRAIKNLKPYQERQD